MTGNNFSWPFVDLARVPAVIGSEALNAYNP